MKWSIVQKGIRMRKRIIKSIVIFLLILGMIVQYMPQDVSTAYAGETMYGIEIAASEITGINDLAVYASQKWLNTTYGKKVDIRKLHKTVQLVLEQWRLL